MDITPGTSLPEDGSTEEPSGKGETFTPDRFTCLVAKAAQRRMRKQYALHFVLQQEERYAGHHSPQPPKEEILIQAAVTRPNIRQQVAAGHKSQPIIFTEHDIPSTVTFVPFLLSTNLQPPPTHRRTQLNPKHQDQESSQSTPPHCQHTPLYQDLLSYSLYPQHPFCSLPLPP